jgi:hypothetical protein
MADSAYRELKRARAVLGRRALRHAPDLRDPLTGRSNVAARLTVADIDVDAASAVAKEVVDASADELLMRFKIYEPYQLAAFSAAYMAGLAHGVQLERMRK